MNARVALSSTGRPLSTVSERPGAVAPLPTHIGKYDVVRVLGRGAMGVVYHAHDPLLDRSVALKVMLPQTAADPDQKARFEREARAAAKIVHRNVLTVFDLGYHQDGSPYIAMELLKGKDLLQTMREEAPLPLDQKLNVIVQLLDGLAHAHEVGVIHRDIKPANVFLAADGTVKIMDFGVARFTMSAATNTGMVMGTPDYMSPEQVQGGKLDGRTDLWSVGCMLHELITGVRPFAAESLMTIFYRITHEPPSPELPPGPQYDLLRPIVKRALARERRPAVRHAPASSRAALREVLKNAAPRRLHRAGDPAAGGRVPAHRRAHHRARGRPAGVAGRGGDRRAGRRHAPGSAAPVVKPAAAVPPPGDEVERRAPARRPDAAVPPDAGRLRRGEDRPPSLRPRRAAAQPVLRAREHPARHDRRRGRAPRARARALRLHRPGDPRDAGAHRAARAQAPRRAAAGEGHPHRRPPRRGHRPPRARHPVRHGRPQRGRLLLRGDGHGGRRRGQGADPARPDHPRGRAPAAGAGDRHQGAGRRGPARC